MIEVAEQISAVRRQVGSRTLEAGEARVVTLSQSYQATVDELWDACTNPERIPRWFLPISGDLRLNGRYQLEGNAGGTIERCEPPHSFAATWEMGGEVSWVEVELRAEPDGRTRFQLEHVAHVDDERWAQFGPGAVGVGWDLALIGLRLHLSSGGSVVDPEQVAEWMLTEAGRQFVAQSSEQWAAASIAAGTDEAAARAAGHNTAEFYTPVPESTPQS